MTGRVPEVQVAVSWAWTAAEPFGGDDDILDARLISNTLTVQYGRDLARPLGEPLVPTAGWNVLNHDRIFSPEWAGSPLYQVIRPGKPTRVRAFLGEHATLYDEYVDYDEDILYDAGELPVPLHAGVLDQPAWDSSLGSPQVIMVSMGGLSRLTRTKISTPISTNLRVDQCIDSVLDAAGWPADLRNLALADTTLEWFWTHETTAFEVLVRLQHTEGVPSMIWESPDGVLHFEHRNYRANTTRSNTPQAACVDHYATVTAITPRLYHAGIGYSAPYTDIYNRTTCPIARRERQAVQQVWELGAALILGANEARVVAATLRDPSDGLVTPTLATDYAVSAGALVGTPSYSDVSAQRVKITFTAGPAGATVLGVTSNGPQIRATPIIVVSEDTVENTLDMSDSIAKYDPIGQQPITLVLQPYPEISRATAEALCDTAVAYYQDVRPIVTVRILNDDEAHIRSQFAWRPSDRITVVSEQLGLEGDMHIEQLVYRLIPEGFETVLLCERALAQPGAAIWDDPASLWDDPGTLWGT